MSRGEKTHQAVETQDTDFGELPTDIFSRKAKPPPLVRPIRLLFLCKFTCIPDVLQSGEVGGFLGGIYEMGFSPIRNSDHVRLEIQD